MSIENEAKIIEILVNQLDKLRDSDGNVLDHEIAATTPIDQLDIDSVAFLQLLYEVEEAFNVRLDDQNPADFKTLRDVGDMLTRYLEGQNGSAQLAPTP